MRKKIIGLILGLCVLGTLTACEDTSETGLVVYDGITIPDYKSIALDEVEVVAVTDADVDAYIQEILDGYTEYEEITDRAVVTGDIVNIDYIGYLDGVEIDGGSAEGYDLTIGSGEFIEGFEEGVIGANIGDVLELELVFPDDYSEDLAGMTTTFTVTVNSIVESTAIELTDEFVQEISTTCTTVAELEAEVLEYLEEESVEDRITELEYQLWTIFIEETIVDEYDETELESIIEQLEASYEEQAEAYDMTIDELVLYIGMTTDDYDTFLLENAQQIYMADQVILYIAIEEDLVPTDEEYQEAIDKLVEYYEYETEEAFLEVEDRDEIENDILTDAVLNWLIETVEIL